MKKTLLVIIIAISILATGCKKDKSKSLNYNDSDPIEMVFQGPYEVYRQINVTSEYDITYKAINEPDHEVITVSGDGKIRSKNVGTAKVKIDNGYENMIVGVNVSLFREPTFEFGCNTARIKSLFGKPYAAGYVQDTILVYQYADTPNCYGYYSYACGELDFYFDVNSDFEYFEADAYIRNNVELVMDRYLNENFDHGYDIHDSIVSPYTGNDTVITTSIFTNKIDENIICGKTPSLNPLHEWCLFYFRTDSDDAVAKTLKRRPRSSKLRY